jgi:hypothetical protein
MCQQQTDGDRPCLWDVCRSVVGTSEELADSAGLGLFSLLAAKPPAYAPQEAGVR